MYRNREQLATRWAHFFKKRRAYRRRFRFWHHIPHTVLWPACLPGNPIIPRSSGTRHSFGLRPPAGGRLFHTAHTVPVPAACHAESSRRIRPALFLSLPAFIKRAAPVPYGPYRACRANKGEGEGFPAPARAAGGTAQTRPRLYHAIQTQRPAYGNIKRGRLGAAQTRERKMAYEKNTGAGDGRAAQRQYPPAFGCLCAGCARGRARGKGAVPAKQGHPRLHGAATPAVTAGPVCRKTILPPLCRIFCGAMRWCSPRRFISGQYART